MIRTFPPFYLLIDPKDLQHQTKIAHYRSTSQSYGFNLIITPENSRLLLPFIIPDFSCPITISIFILNDCWGRIIVLSSFSAVLRSGASQSGNSLPSQSPLSFSLTTRLFLLSPFFSPSFLFSLHLFHPLFFRSSYPLPCIQPYNFRPTELSSSFPAARLCLIADKPLFLATDDRNASNTALSPPWTTLAGRDGG
ncbi:hypothetical protein ASPWEDRAFT_584838 [Aspergillus wentii DTO 134E9]|uniref:Uncharacterized protein n=1 Tax=Aspergillus wentii DTO 134E9 TaxID=1073089 RepID=A0A1L9RHT7_ASPWE|nr:uncharacterized protein ASPWEDRAFT_584838 [Aspergillus wentii DTO 134E9]OJJ34496.1 hypothetical protein ASPWEDRAFT_584838 [Aspergillus wentii DTO 134E9]